MLIDLNGEQIYLATGHREFDPDLPTLIFVHGAGMDHLVWSVFTRYFAHHGFNVLTPDLPGHGRSNAALRTSIVDMSDWVAELAGFFNLKSCSIVVQSMGGLVALETSSRHPALVSNTILIGVTFPMRVGPPLLEAAHKNDVAAIDMMVTWGHDGRQQMGANRVPGIRVVNLARRWLEAAAPGVIFNDLNACNDYDSAEAALGNIDGPIHIIIGDSDRMTPPKVAKQIASDRDNVDFYSIPNCGHGCMVEQPEATHRLLVGALRH